MTVIEILAHSASTPNTKLLARHSWSLGNYAQQVIKNGWLPIAEVEGKIRPFVWILERAKLNGTVTAPGFSVTEFENAVEQLFAETYIEPETAGIVEAPDGKLENVFTEIHVYDRNIPDTLQSLLQDDEDVTEQKIWIAWQGMMEIITAYQNGMAAQTAIAKQKTCTALKTTLTGFNGSWQQLKTVLENFEEITFGKTQTDYEAEPTLLTEMPDTDDNHVTIQCNDGWQAIIRCDTNNIQVCIVKGKTILIFPVYFY